MNLCSDGHDAICYEGRNRPACYHIADLNTTIAENETKIDELTEALKIERETIEAHRQEINQLRGI